jgi:hypothetical protein
MAYTEEPRVIIPRVFCSLSVILVIANAKALELQLGHVTRYFVGSSIMLGFLISH